MAEKTTWKVKKVGIKRVKGYVYYLKDGDVWKAKRAVKGSGQLHKKLGLKPDLKSYMYFVDGAGDVSRSKRGKRGEASRKSKKQSSVPKKKRKAVSRTSTTKSSKSKKKSRAGSSTTRAPETSTSKKSSKSKKPSTRAPAKKRFSLWPWEL